MPLEELDGYIRTCSFHHGKAIQIREIAQGAVERFDGVLPGDFDVLTSFNGVGPKCANLVLGISCGQGRIAVDVHVHRITHRWGYTASPTPEKALAELEAKLPPEYHIEINALLVPFGKNICVGRSPKCSTCPLFDMCPKIGVTTSR